MPSAHLPGTFLKTGVLVMVPALFLAAAILVVWQLSWRPHFDVIESLRG